MVAVVLVEAHRLSPCCSDHWRPTCVVVDVLPRHAATNLGSAPKTVAPMSDCSNLGSPSCWPPGIVLLVWEEVQLVALAWPQAVRRGRATGKHVSQCPMNALWCFWAVGRRGHFHVWVVKQMLPRPLAWCSDVVVVLEVQSGVWVVVLDEFVSPCEPHSVTRDRRRNLCVRELVPGSSHLACIGVRPFLAMILVLHRRRCA